MSDIPQPHEDSNGGSWASIRRLPASPHSYYSESDQQKQASTYPSDRLLRFLPSKTVIRVPSSPLLRRCWLSAVSNLCLCFRKTVQFARSFSVLVSRTELRPSSIPTFPYSAVWRHPTFHWKNERTLSSSELPSSISPFFTPT